MPSSLLARPRILLSPLDGIGDIVLTLPMAGVIKAHLRDSTVLLLGSEYSSDIVALSEHVDEFLSHDALLRMPEREQIDFLRARRIDAFVHVSTSRRLAVLARRAGIPLRVGTRHRWFHWGTCNRLPALSRSRLPLHEAQGNLRLLAGLGLRTDWPLRDLWRYIGLTRMPVLRPEFRALLQPGKRRIVLHPKSRGHGREWGLENFSRLASLLPPDRYQVFLSGTEREREELRPWLARHPEVVDVVGRLPLSQFVALLAETDGLVASGTGPLHLAAAMGIPAVGLFPPMPPIHPGRWAPLGPRAAALAVDRECRACRGRVHCPCIESIPAETVLARLESL